MCRNETAVPVDGRSGLERRAGADRSAAPYSGNPAVGAASLSVSGLTGVLAADSAARVSSGLTVVPPPIQSRVDALAFSVEACVDAVALPVQAVLGDNPGVR